MTDREHDDLTVACVMALCLGVSSPTLRVVAAALGLTPPPVSIDAGKCDPMIDRVRAGL